MKKPVFVNPSVRIFFLLIGFIAVFGLLLYSGIHNGDNSFGAAVTGNAPGPRSSALPSCIKDWEQEPMLNGIVAYLKDSRNSNVIRAWNPCQNVPEILQLIKQDLIDAETKRITQGIKELPDAPLPENWDVAYAGTANYVNCGSSAHEIIASKVAAKFLVDYWDLVPWNLWDYSSEDLERLFTNDAESGYCNFYNVVDHSPREAWNVLASQYDITTIQNPAQLTETIMKSTRGSLGWRHGGVWVDSSGNIIKQDNQGIRTLKQTWEEKISRHGCWTMTAYFQQLASDFIVPGYIASNQYAEPGHATVLFPVANLVDGHGDHSYNAILADTPALQVFDDYGFWKREVIKKNPTTMSYRSSQLHEYEMGRVYPSYYTMYNFCHYSYTSAGKSYPSGRDYLLDVSTYKGYRYWSDAQLDQLEIDIKAKTQNCGFIPADNPQNP